MAVVIEVLREEWADHAVALPDYASAGAAGADLRANSACRGPAARAAAETGRAASGADGPARGDPRGPRDAGSAALGPCAEPRGGPAQTAPARIDSDYRGPLGVILVNFGAAAFRVRHGARIAQAVIAPVAAARWVAARSLDDTARGAGGFGSTGAG